MISHLSSIVPSCRHSLILNQFVFFFLTALFLWVPIKFSGAFPIPVQSYGIYALAALLTVRYYLSLDNLERRINLLSYGMILFGLWVVISTGMHCWALDSLNPEAYLPVPKSTALKTDKYSAMWTLYHIAQIHLFFLALLLVSISIFRSTESGWKNLAWLPLILIPCLLVALYQFYIDNSFLSNRSDPLGGLGTDLSAFRNSLFLIFPVSVFAVITTKDWLFKILYIFLTIVIYWLMKSSGGKAVIIGTLLFVAAFPMVGAWVHGFQSDKGRRYLYFGLVWILVLTLLIGIAVSKSGSSMSVMFSDQVRSTYIDIFNKKNYYLINDRIEMQRQAWRLIRLSPIAGWGPGGYLRNLDRVRFVNGDPFVEAQYVPNLYLDWGADLGLLGGGGALFVHMMPLWMVLRIRKQIQTKQERWAVGIVFATLAIMFLLFNVGPHTYFPETQWIFVVYLGFLISIAQKHGYTIPPIKGWLWGIGGLLLTLFFIAGTYSTTFGSKGYDAIYKAVIKPYKSNYGYYYDYHGQNWVGEKNQWIIKNTVSTVRASSNILQLNILVPPRNGLDRDLLRLKVFLNDKSLDERHFFKGGDHNLGYYVPGIENRTIEIRTELGQTRNPYRGDDFDFDGIVQSVAFIKVVPEDGIGFYPWEKMGKRRPPHWPQESKTERIRWTGIQATMNISANLRKTGIIYLMSLHPGPDQYPVLLDIMVDGKVIRQEELNDYKQWRKVYFTPDDLKNFSTMTFRVDKTWNPLMAGFSDDHRDLGIYMIVPEIE